MTFFLEHRTLKCGNKYDLKARPDLSAQEEQSTAASDPNVAERFSGANMELSPDLNEERIKANLEHLHAQITALTQMMDRLAKL